MKIVFMGTPDFAVPCLKTLIDNKYEVAAVVTQPDRPKGRGNKLTPPPVKELALEHGLDVLQPEKVKNNIEFLDKLKSINPELIVVVAFGQILPKEILDLPKYGCINVHGSLLPKYRGAAPIQWSVINGDKTTGITTMYMDVGLDTGDMILKRETAILENETSGELFDRLSILGAETLMDTIKQIENGTTSREKQDDSEATYTTIIKKDLGNIDWTKSAIEIKNLIRGTYPWPGAYTYYKGSKVKLFNVDLIDKDTGSKSGTIVDVNNEGILVETGKQLIIIKEVQFEGGKRMAVKEYLKGHSIEKNEILCGDNNGTEC